MACPLSGLLVVTYELNGSALVHRGSGFRAVYVAVVHRNGRSIFLCSGIPEENGRIDLLPAIKNDRAQGLNNDTNIKK